jgi:hypothetical protein
VKTSVTLDTSLLLSVRPYVSAWLTLDGFPRNFILTCMSSKALQIWLKSEKKLALLLEYLSTVLLVLQLDRSAKEIHCCIYMTNLNTFIFLTATCTSPTIQGSVILSFHGRNGKANAQPFYVIRTLPILLSIRPLRLG